MSVDYSVQACGGRPQFNSEKVCFRNKLNSGLLTIYWSLLWVTVIRSGGTFSTCSCGQFPNQHNFWSSNLKRQSACMWGRSLEFFKGCRLGHFPNQQNYFRLSSLHTEYLTVEQMCMPVGAIEFFNGNDCVAISPNQQK